MLALVVRVGFGPGVTLSEPSFLLVLPVTRRGALVSEHDTLFTLMPAVQSGSLRSFQLPRRCRAHEAM